MILVSGSTGTIGGEVARQLIQGGHKPRLLVRNSSKAIAYQGKAEFPDRRSLDRHSELTYSYSSTNQKA